MTVSPSAWRSFLCLSFVQGCLANSNLLYVCDNSETCPIALIIVGMARVMGVGLLYHNEAKELTEESVPEIILPYINYQPAEVDSESEPVEAEYCEPIIETPIRRKPQSAADRQLQDWFDRDCHLDLTKEN